MVASYRVTPPFAWWGFLVYTYFMTYLLESIRQMPVGLWPLDTTPPFQDYSGYGRFGTATGTPRQYVSLSSGTQFASVLDNDLVASFDSPVFISGKETQPFSLEAIVRTIDYSQEQQILGHTGQMDGLVISGTIVSFVTKYSSTGECRAEYDLQVGQAIHVVGVHTEEKNSLYVNGQLVSEVYVSTEQSFDTFANADGTLYSGESDGTASIAVNNIMIYAHALSGRSVQSLFNASRDVVSSESVPYVYGGTSIPVTVDIADFFLNQTWSTTNEWSMGAFRDITVQDGQLRPQIIGTTSVYGEWRTIYDISSSDSDSIYGVTATWDGQGASIEVSLDGETWSPVEKGRTIDLIPVGFDPTDKVLEVRVTFAGGIEDDPSYLDYLNLVGLRTGQIPMVGGRQVTLTQPATLRYGHSVIEMRDDTGVELLGGKLTISGIDDFNIGTEEFWLKRLDSSQIALSPSGGDIFVNGEASSLNDIGVGEWCLVHVVRDPAIPGDISISGNVIVSQAAVYEQALSAETVYSIYSSYTGVPAIQAGDKSDIAVTEYSEAVDIYAFDWSITGAG